MYNFYFSNNISIKWFIFTGVVLHIIACYFSVGYYNADEHYQIIGPLEKLLGIENQLTWEFNYRIRPWLQPYFYFVIAKIFYFFDINNPFTIMFTLRLISSIIGLISIIYLYDHIKYKFRIDNNFSKIIIFSFWFYAFLHARTSSENLSISMLILGIVYFDKFISDTKVKNKFYLAFISGVFLGLSMVLRYQIVTSVFFIFLWFLLTNLNLNKLKYVILNSFVIIFILLCSLIFDYFGYGLFNNTFYQYYHANFVANWFSSFGQDPWWYYLKLYFETFFPPVNIILFASFLFFLFREFKNILTFVTIPVLIILSLLSHKELRFIFPILIFSPFFISYFFSNTRLFFGKTFLISFSIILNFCFSLLLFVPATEQVRLYEYLYYNQNETEKIIYYDKNPYIIDELEPRIYTNYLKKISKYKDINDLNDSLIIINDFKSYQYFKNSNNCYSVFSVYPQFIYLNKNWRDKNFNWAIFKCK